MEIKLTPTIRQNAGLGLDSEIIRVEAEGFFETCCAPVTWAKVCATKCPQRF